MRGYRKKREGKKFALTDKEFKNALGEGNIYTTSPKEYMEKVNNMTVLCGMLEIENIEA